MPFIDAIRNFIGGVVTSEKADQIPSNASPRGRNSYLASIGPEAAVVSKRRGFSTINSTKAAASAVTGQFQYKRLSSGTFTRYHLVVLDDGRIGTLASDPGGAGTYTSITTGIFTGSTPCDFAAAQNLAFIVNGTAQKKYDGTNLRNFGITAPATAPSLATGAAGTPSGTYEARVTYVNSSTGHESSAGTTSATVTVVAQKIEFSSIPTSSDAQVDTRKVYLRNTSTQANFYLATTINDNTTTTYSYNQADTLLVTLGPNSTENNPPPTTVKYLTYHRSRMFAADDNTLYYSQIELPEAFDPDFNEPVDAQNSQKIKGLASFNDVLVVLKERSMYGIFGVDPDSWSVRLLSADIGCTSHRSITIKEGVMYWWSHLGPVMWTGEGFPEPIGLPTLSGTINNTTLDASQYTNVVAASLEQAQLILFSVSDNGDTTNTRTLAWSWRARRWVTDGWNGLEIASLAVVEDNSNRRWTYFGNPNGQVFRFWDTDTDGVPSGTVTGTFTAGGTSITTITSSGFYTTGDALAYRFVTVEDSNGDLVAQRRISSNTATVLTLASSITGLTSGATYTFHVGGPCWEWDTKWTDADAPMVKKRFYWFFLKTEDSAATIRVSLYTDFNDAIQRRHSFSTNSTTKSVLPKRLRAAFSGTNWKARIANRAADAPCTLYEVGMMGDALSSKLG
jgi:hypothetical protein